MASPPSPKATPKRKYSPPSSDVEDPNRDEDSVLRGSNAAAENAFDPQRTVVFYPIYKRFREPSVQRLIDFFGEVESIKLLTKEESGCAVVVFKTVAGVHCSWHYVREMEYRVNLMKYLSVRFLWPPVNFWRAVFQNELSSSDDAVKEYRVVQVPVTESVDQRVVLEMLQFFGPLETYRIVFDRFGAVFHATFKRSIDAISSVVCNFDNDLHPALYLGDTGNQEVTARPAWHNIIRFPISVYIHDVEIDNMYENLWFQYQYDLATFTNPSKIFANDSLDTSSNAIRLPIVEGELSSLIVATRKDELPWKYFDVKLELVIVETVGMDTAGPEEQRRWASYFYLTLERWYCAEHDKYRISPSYKPMNFLFPKLYPHVFEGDDPNFEFALPSDYTITPVPEENAPQQHGDSSRPFVSFQLPSANVDCCKSSVCDIPIAIHSESIPF